jgi:signal transduction histidine kinase
MSRREDSPTANDRMEDVADKRGRHGVEPARLGLSDDNELSETATRLVYAVCHEIGNLVAAVRLQAHLLDEEMAPKELAVTSVEIDDLAARTSAMLALIRPLLSASPAEGAAVSPAQISAGISQALEDHGGRGMVLEVECDPDLPMIVTDPEVMHHLILTLVFGAVEAGEHKGQVTVRTTRSGDDVMFCIEDDADEAEQLLDWKDHMLRGRPLSCAIADFILRSRSGRLEVRREDGLTQVLLILFSD